MEEEFLSLEAYNEREKHPTLSVSRKRHRRSRNLNPGQEVKTKVLRVSATSGSGEKETAVGPRRLRELITLSITSLFGEYGNEKRFKWDLYAFSEKTNSGELRVSTSDFSGFRAALALLPPSEGRIRIKEVEVSS